MTIKTVLEVYAKRWRVENKLSEMVSFFNLNALSSPIMIRIHFDILWTMIADTFYHRLAYDLRRFEKNIAPTIFKKFIDIRVLSASLRGPKKFSRLPFSWLKFPGRMGSNAFFHA